MFRTKINSCISDQLYNRGVAMDDYTNLKVEAIKVEASNKARDNEQRLQGISVGKGHPFVSTTASSTPATKTSTGTTFGRQGQPLDLCQVKMQGLCFTCHQKGHISCNCPRSEGPWCIKCWVKCQRWSVWNCCRSKRRKRRMCRVFSSLSNKGSIG